jgi:hypothetical protein
VGTTAVAAGTTGRLAADRVIVSATNGAFDAKRVMVAWRVAAVLLKVKDVGRDCRWGSGAGTDEVCCRIFVDLDTEPLEPFFLIAQCFTVGADELIDVMVGQGVRMSRVLGHGDWLGSSIRIFCVFKETVSSSNGLKEMVMWDINGKGGNSLVAKRTPSFAIVVVAVGTVVDVKVESAVTSLTPTAAAAAATATSS